MQQDIVSFMQGGLGNQLFQYATAFALSQRTGAQVKVYTHQVDLHHGPYCLDQVVKHYQKTDHAILLDTRWRRYRHRLGLNKTLYVEPTFKCYHPEVMQLKPPVQLNGFFLFHRYFDAYANALRAQFQWPIQSPDIQAALTNMRSQISVSMHVRIGDYLNSAIQKSCGVMPLDMAYYKRTYALMRAWLGDQVHFYIFTNDAAYVHQHFDFCHNKTVLDGDQHLAHEALYAMSQCHHHILANSTFSWWGAWLNPNEDRYILAPRAWHAKSALKDYSLDYYMNYLPEHWICV